MTNEITSTKIKVSDTKELEKIKSHPRISNHEIISDLIVFFKRYKNVVEKETK